MFDNLIVSKNSELLNLWIKDNFPNLADDSKDILRGTFRRTRNEMMNYNFEEREWKTDEVLYRFARKECLGILPSEENKKKNLGLTKGEFKTLVSQLKSGDETIIEKVYLSHFETCILILMRNANCTKEEANDSCMDALVEIRTDLLRDKIMYGNLKSYFTTRAINKFYKSKKGKKIDVQAIDDGISVKDEFNIEEDLLERDLKDMVKRAIEKLGEECRYILKQVYYEETNMNEISKKMNKNHGAIRKQASRCRSKLKEYISDSFYKQFAAYFE